MLLAIVLGNDTLHTPEAEIRWAIADRWASEESLDIGSRK